jgi:hypothetical protein
VSYKIVPAELVHEEMYNILTESLIIHSQERFQAILIKKLKKIDPQYELSPQRLRRIAARSDDIILEIKCRTSTEKSEESTCPVCNSKMNPTKNQTLYNWEVVIGHKCKVCGYWTGNERRIPVRYIFKLKE